MGQRKLFKSPNFIKSSKKAQFLLGFLIFVCYNTIRNRNEMCDHRLRRAELSLKTELTPQMLLFPLNWKRFYC